MALFCSCFVLIVIEPMPFLSPEDHLEQTLDLRQRLVRRPAATFFLRVKGDSMAGCRIHDRDLLVVDKSVEPNDGDIVVAAVAGGFVVRRLKRAEGGWALDGGPEQRPIRINPETGDQVWGVVLFSITEQCRR